jgi:hypothetical protein
LFPFKAVKDTVDSIVYQVSTSLDADHEESQNQQKHARVENFLIYRIKVLTLIYTRRVNHQDHDIPPELTG